MTRPWNAVRWMGVLVLLTTAVSAQQWPQFRGPNGSGVAVDGHLPLEFGPAKNVVWRIELPSGYSSPVVSQGRIFLTAYDNEALWTLCLEQSSGKILWKKQAPRARQEPLDPRNNPASPSPVTDGTNVIVFFGDYGLLCYDFEGQERWRLPLGPFTNLYGMGASPILADDKAILVCDQQRGSFVVAVDLATGKVVWKVDRPEAKSGHSTPVLYTPEGEPPQIVAPGSFLLTAYAADSGEKVWWTPGLSFEMKSTPVMGEGMIYINGYGSPMNDPEQMVAIPEFSEVLASHDADKDGRISKQESPDRTTRAFFPALDLNRDGFMDGEDWNYYRAAMATKNGMLGIRLGGHGDRADNLIWQYHKSVPQLPSPLLHRGVLYMINDGGIATAFNPADGAVIAKGRLRGAIGNYYASPVAAGDRVLMLNETGKASVLKADGSLEVLAVNDLDAPCYATPAIVGDRLYIRTTKELYCFSESAASAAGAGN